MTEPASGGAPGPAASRPWPADRVERRPIASLHGYQRNSRVHSDAQIDRIARSIEHFGWTNPIIINPDGMILAGHARVTAAERLGLTEVPAMVVEGWTDEEQRAYVISDNQLALDSTWNTELLQGEVADLRDSGFDTELLGFTGHELDGLLEDWGGLAGRVDGIEASDDAAPGKLVVTFDERHRADVRRAVELAVDELGLEGIRVA